MVEIIKAKYEHVPLIEARPDDVREFQALGIDPFDAMLHGIDAPGEALVCVIDDDVVCMFGVSEPTMLGKVGRPWMIADKKIEDHEVPFLRKSWEVVGRWSEMYDLLENHIDLRNRRAIRWLKCLGFKFHESTPVNGVPFIRFTKEGVCAEQQG